MDIPTWDELKPWEQDVIRRVCEKHKACFGTGRIGYNKKGEKIPCTCFYKGLGYVIKGRELAERNAKDIALSVSHQEPIVGNQLGEHPILSQPD